MKSDDFIAKGDCGRLRASFGHTGGREEFFRRTRRRKNDLNNSPPAGGELCEAFCNLHKRSGYFTMMMVVDLAACETPFDQLRTILKDYGEGRGLSIRIQREDIFDAMHKL